MFRLWSFSPGDRLLRRFLFNFLEIWGSRLYAERHALCDMSGRNEVGPRMYPVATHQTVTVLIVEDDGEMRSLLCDEFGSEGYQLREAKDGDEALKMAQQSEVDLILTDFRMPAGGAEYIVRLHALAPHCPIIVMTAFGDAGLRAEVLRAGASAYFDKPVRVAALKQKVEALLSDARGTRYEDRF